MAVVALSPVARQQFFGADGIPLAGGQLFTYIGGTTTPQATYTDSTGTILNSNPIILDSGGFASIWLSASVYKFVLQDALGVTQWTVDGILGGNGSQNLLASQKFTAGGTFTVPAGVNSAKVTVIAAGGGGGGATAAVSGGGGGAGGSAIKWLSGLTSGGTLAVVVGASGAVTVGASGSAGGDSSVSSGTIAITTIQTHGGGGGITGALPGGGAPGAVSTGGDVNQGGGAGNAGQPALNLGGVGGGSFYGGGGAAGPPNIAGVAASIFGAGGGGAGGSVGNTAGGIGGAGVVIFEFV